MFHLEIITSLAHTFSVICGILFALGIHRRQSDSFRESLLTGLWQLFTVDISFHFFLSFDFQGIER
jgi:hypothetical protein